MHAIAVAGHRDVRERGAIVLQGPSATLDQAAVQEYLTV